jgi:NAD-dependent deacetylase
VAAPLRLPKLRDFHRIVFFTGAGMSAESGIPTYRGRGGIWQKYNYEDYACQRAFDRDPDKVWDFHDQRRATVAGCEPNAGHQLLARVQKEKPATAIITQNIDGMHQRAGSAGVIELHGSLWRVRCDREGKVRPEYALPVSPRTCPCGAYLRPDIVWFEDALDPHVVLAAKAALAGCQLLISIGTSGVVYPAADLPRIAMENGAVTVEINLEDTPLSRLYQHHLRGPASQMLAELAS